MPKVTGFSHALAAVVIVLVSPFLKRFVELLVTKQDIVTAVTAMAELISSHPRIPLGSDLTTTLLYLGIVALLAFTYGYAYHVTRHS